MRSTLFRLKLWAQCAIASKRGGFGIALALSPFTTLSVLIAFGVVFSRRLRETENPMCAQTQLTVSANSLDRAERAHAGATAFIQR